MTKQKIYDKDVTLRTAINKASDNGFSYEKWLVKNGVWPGSTSTIHITYSIESLIFNHDFAKALWGEKDVDTGTTVIDEYDHVIYDPAWQYHLQQMVIADDPIKYLGDNI